MHAKGCPSNKPGRDQFKGGIIASGSLSPFFFMGFLDSRTCQKNLSFLIVTGLRFLPSPMIKARTRRHFILPFSGVRKGFLPDSWDQSSPVTCEMTGHENYSFHTFELSWMFIVENV